MNMNTLSKNLFLVTLSLLVVSTTAYADGGKGLIRGAKKGLEKIEVKAPQGIARTGSLYKWSESSTRLIENSIRKGTFAQQYGGVTNSAARTLTNIDWVKPSLETNFLQMSAEEAKHYDPEMKSVQQLSQILSEKGLATGEVKNRIQSNHLIEQLPNASLRNSLNASLSKEDWASFGQDLTQYYSTGENGVAGAYNYLLRHPHKVTLYLRRLMRNPAVETPLKTRMADFLHQSEIPAQQRAELWNTISAMHQQYTTYLQQAQDSEAVQTRLRFLTETRTALEDFIQQNGRRPKWNSADPNEQRLEQNIRWALMRPDGTMHMAQLDAEMQQIQQLWQSTAPTFWTFEQTAIAFENFVKTTGQLYPNSLRENPQASQEEADLFDNLFYWRNANASMEDIISQIQKKWYKR